MGIITRMLKQTAVYWPPAVIPFDDQGMPAFGTPVEVSCRWEDVHEEFITPQGTREVCNAKVFVSVDVEPGGLLFHGELSTVEASGFPADPRDYHGVWEIRRFEKLPSLKATEFLRTALL